MAKHLTAEAKTEEFVKGKGVVVKWERLRKQNHWFDALYNACAAGHACGVQLVQEQLPEQPQAMGDDEERVSFAGHLRPWIGNQEMRDWLRR